MHITMLIKNSEGEQLQCVIDSAYKEDFEALGFVDNDAKLKEKPKPKKRATKVKVKADA